MRIVPYVHSFRRVVWMEVVAFCISMYGDINSAGILGGAFLIFGM